MPLLSKRDKMPQPPCSPSTNVTKMLGTARQTAFTGPFLLLRSHCRRLETKLNLDSTVIRAKYCFFVFFFSRGIYTFRKPEQSRVGAKICLFVQSLGILAQFRQTNAKVRLRCFYFCCHLSCLGLNCQN